MGVDPATERKTDRRLSAASAFPRLEQTFPELTAQEIARMRRFGEVRHYKDGETLFKTGKPGPGMFVILSGHVAITQRDGFGHVTPVIDQGPGQFLAEIGQLSGRVALVDGHAEGDVETLLIPPERLRALLVAEADLGERIMRALILRRVSLIQGRQDGASARIENYLGFPEGISGQALAGRAFAQAQKFGADIMIPMAAKSLDCARTDGAFALALDGGDLVRARSVVVASGARYRRPEIENLDKFEGRGVWYWASPIEARLCAEQEIALVGGGNSAGQAAVFLSGHARKVHMMIRGGGLGASMSRYLIERIEATPNIELVFNAEIVGLEGSEDGPLERVRWRSRLSAEESTLDIRNLVLFAGADPATGWLDGCGVTLDRGGFVVTGAQSEQNLGRPVPPLETSVPGVFAVGDVRSGSVKRVGGAIGEGAQVVAALHGFLGDAPKPAL